ENLRRQEVEYHVQVPPEYHVGRNYPVLFVLHPEGGRPLDMLAAWSGLAAQHGYILVAPAWVDGLGPTYNYTVEEHAAVVEVLRDLRRRFQVDSDRVFLFGFSEGGNMAYDVGLSHPDLFAGVAPMGGRPRYFATVYWRNAQYLPFYAVNGTYEGESTDRVRRQFSDWVGRGFPALMVQDKGRGLEPFPVEFPTILEWMSRKKRAAGSPELGKHALGSSLGDEFYASRHTDNRFYWLSSDILSDRCVNDARHWDN